MREPKNATRRQFLASAGSAAVLGTVPIVTLRPAEATPAMMAGAIRDVVGTAVVRTGKVKLDVTAEDHVRSIHVFVEKNPQPNVGNFVLGPRAGRAQISTRIRLADSQKIVAIAKMSNGSFWSATVDVVVTLAACTEEVI
jgi:sulfur-oxidizing protein SoxY